MAQQHNADPGRVIVEVSRSHTLDTHTAVRTPLKRWSAPCRIIYLNNKYNTHALSGILTREPSSGAAAELLLRPQIHRDRPPKVYERACHWSLFGVTALPHCLPIYFFVYFDNIWINLIYFSVWPLLSTHSRLKGYCCICSHSVTNTDIR